MQQPLRRRVQDRRDNAVNDRDQTNRREHRIQIYIGRNPEHVCHQRYKNEPADQCGDAAADRAQDAFLPNVRQNHVRETRGRHRAQRFADQIAVGKARFRGQNFDAGRHHADAETLAIRRFRQQNRHAIRRDHPIRREPRDGGRRDM